MEKVPQAPLSRDEIDLLLVHIGWPVGNPMVMELTYKLARLVEEAHGITMNEKPRCLKPKEVTDANQ